MCITHVNVTGIQATTDSHKEWPPNSGHHNELMIILITLIVVVVVVVIAGIMCLINK